MARTTTTGRRSTIRWARRAERSLRWSRFCVAKTRRESNAGSRICFLDMRLRVSAAGSSRTLARPPVSFAVEGEALMGQLRREWWAGIREYFDDSLILFSEEGRPRRERAAVREFLKYLGVDFDDHELTVPEQDGDVDVRFRGARFQNVERMEPGRRRHDEVRRMADRVPAARDVSALHIPRGD